MKYANLIFNGVVTKNDIPGFSLMNIGEPLEILAIDAIYDSMGIKKEERIDIDYYELDTYSGEYVILPINFMFAYLKFFMQNAPAFSPKIIPIFLGIAIHARNLSQESIKCLRNYAPIGCRDEFTLELMRKYQIPAYLFGCITLTFPKRLHNPQKQKAFFIDAPIGISEYVPMGLLDNAEYLSHMYYGKTNDLCQGNLKKWAVERIDRYKNEATLIITSRFHAALIGIAMGIPTILVLNRVIDKYRWLEKFIPIYTPQNYSEINWNPSPVYIEELKEKMKRLAVKRIEDSYNKYKCESEISDIMESSFKKSKGDIEEYIYDGFSYYEHARDFIKSNWNKDTEIKYAMWGLGKTASDLYHYICENYPNAQLYKLYDAQQIIFEGMQSEDPFMIRKNEDVFMFVTSTQACYPAAKYFEKLGINKESYYLCRNKYFLG